MPPTLNLTDARAVLRADVLGPDEIRAALGSSAGEVPPIPFSREELDTAMRLGEMLILRVAASSDGVPLTILNMCERFPVAFDQKLLRQVGYQLKEEWGIAIEPLAKTETCKLAWALVRKEVLEDSRNLSFDEQQTCLQQYAAKLGRAGATLRRRTAVEAVYDTLLYFRARQARLLATTWDWCASRTVDGGLLNVGGFGPGGMQILSFSRGIRHGGLGVCPTRSGA